MDNVSSSAYVLKVTVSLVDRIVLLLIVPVVVSFHVKIVPGGKLLNVTEGIPGLTPVGLTRWIPFLISDPMMRAISSTTTDVPLYVKNSGKKDGILDGCDDGLELGTLDGFALGAALSGLTLIMILEERSWQGGRTIQRDRKEKRPSDMISGMTTQNQLTARRRTT